MNSMKWTESQTEAVKLIVKHLFSCRVTQAVFSALSKSRPSLPGGTKLLPTPVRDQKKKKKNVKKKNQKNPKHYGY